MSVTNLSPKQDHSIIRGPEFIAGYVAPEYLVDGVIQKKRLCALTANPYHGKTAVALHLAFCVDQGVPFGGHETEKSRVLFLAGENPDDAKARAIVAAENLGVEIQNIDFMAGTFDINEEFPSIKEQAIRLGGYGLVIIDSNTAFFQGAEENSNTESRDNAHMQRLFTDLPGDPAVVALAHPVKKAAKENLYPRGGGAYFAEIDANLTLWSDDHKTTQLHWLGKIRGPQFEPFSFEMNEVHSDLVKDHKGRVIPSVVAVPINDEKAAKLALDARSDEDAMLDMLINLPNASYAQWADKLNWFSKTGTPSKSRINRAITELKSDKLVRTYRKKSVLTKTGRKEAKKVVEYGSFQA